MHDLKAMAAVELHLNVTYYVQCPALKSVNEKSQLVMGAKFFTPIRQCLK